MKGIEKEYYDEIKKNNKLVMDEKNIKNWTKPDNENEIYDFLKSVFEIDKKIDGVLLAFDKNIYTGKEGTVYNEEYKLFAPHIYNENNKYVKYDINMYDYTSGQWEWWTIPSTNLNEYMSKPFLGAVTGFEIIINSFPIIVDDKFY